MHVLTNAEKLIPLRDAASLAESRRLAGMRMVTGTTSPSTRYERISVSPASCSIKSAYVIASHAFKPQYKCINYTPAWEQRKLGDVTDSFSGGTPDGSHASYYGGSIPFIRSAEINSDKTELFLTEKGLDNSSAKIVERGTVLYALYGATSGEVGIAAIKGAINQAILALSPHTGNDPLFLASWLRREKARIVDTYLQGGQGNLSGSIVKELSFALPQQKEQQVIGSFFSHLDNLITLHQRKRQWLKWLDEGGEGTHHDIDILVFKFADDMKISVLCGVHACMTKSLGHTGNRYAGKQQQRGMGVP